jgi:hypothetical protein
MKNAKAQFLNLFIFIILTGFFVLPDCYSQIKQKSVYEHLKQLPHDLTIDNNFQRIYLMTAEYYNRDIYGSFMNKVRVTGEYTRGLGNLFVEWNNCYIAFSDSLKKDFPTGIKQDYMENLTYIPSNKMLEKSAFEKFPADPNSVYSKNLIWDMMAIETFAWQHFNDLQLNQPYVVPELKGEFQMADVGSYEHTNVQLCWTGISKIRNELCAILEYKAFDNLLNMNTAGIKTKGIENYWGSVYVSLTNMQVEFALMHSNTVQDIEIEGVPQNLIVNTTRHLKVELIK